jgi:thioredoxin 1
MQLEVCQGIASVFSSQALTNAKYSGIFISKESAMENEVKLTKDNFEAEVIKSDIPVLVDFWAKWCMPCKMIAPALEEMSAELAGRLKIGKVNVDEEGDLAVKYGIESLPSIFLFNKGQIAERQVGAAPKAALENLVKPYLA